jgi:uncharacterized membrane protein YbaN (DUF454 family)
MAESNRNNLINHLLIVAGTISLIVAIIGIVVPILPTTPLLLLAALCYMRGSRRLYNWLLNNRYIGTYISNYLQGKGMSVKMKIWTLTLLWATILISVFLFAEEMVVKIILFIVLVLVTIHILTIRTMRSR